MSSVMPENRMMMVMVVVESLLDELLGYQTVL
jgi:hypothetical protein